MLTKMFNTSSSNKEDAVTQKSIVFLITTAVYNGQIVMIYQSVMIVEGQKFLFRKVICCTL